MAAMVLFSTAGCGSDDVEPAAQAALDLDERAAVETFARYWDEAAVVVACIDEDGWTYSVPGREPVRPDSGWRTLGRELTRIDGEWRVSDYSPESSRDSCD